MVSNSDTVYFSDIRLFNVHNILLGYFTIYIMWCIIGNTNKCSINCDIRGGHNMTTQQIHMVALLRDADETLTDCLFSASASIIGIQPDAPAQFAAPVSFDPSFQ